MADGHEIAMALRGAYLAMHRQADVSVAPFDLTANQFVLLALLDEQDGVSQRNLVDRGSSDPNTIRPILRNLQKKGLVERESDPNDGRAWLVRITKSGRQTFRKARTGSEAFRERLCANLDGHERESLARLLREVADAMTDSVSENVE